LAILIGTIGDISYYSF